MNCKKAKKLMSAYIDDMLSDSKKSAFEAHLEHCESCKNEFLVLNRIRTAVLGHNLRYLFEGLFLPEEIGENLFARWPHYLNDMPDNGEFCLVIQLLVR